MQRSILKNAVGGKAQSGNSTSSTSGFPAKTSKSSAGARCAGGGGIGGVGGSYPKSNGIKDMRDSPMLVQNLISAGGISNESPTLSRVTVDHQTEWHKSAI